jgi:translation initiation factor 3 subunit B
MVRSEESDEEFDMADMDFSDSEDFVDDIEDAELLADLIKQRPKESDGVDSVIIVDGIPIVGAERLEKLKGVIRKIFQKFGKIVTEHYPIVESGETKGYIFLEFSKHEDAVEAVKNTNNLKLDKHHSFTVNLFSDFAKHEAITEQWEPPKEEPYVNQGNRKTFMLNEEANDQYAIVFNGGEKVGVYRNALPDALTQEVRERWTESYIKWSPMGSYMATCHSRGIALWGGPQFQKVARFNHPGVQFIDFSPCEKYIVTFSPSVDARFAEDSSAVIIWESRTGAKKRAFNAESSHTWPIFKWSNDDKYFARMTADGTLSIYETPSFGLLDRKSIKVNGMRDFTWSPTENILAYWVAEDKDVPARVTLLEVPTRNEVRVKNLFNVADCKMHWQKTGNYLCVKVDRYAKLRKETDDTKYAGLYCNFEIFHMREKQIPVDSVEIKENVHAFAWEPVGTKFAIIHGESQSLCVSFYSVTTGQTPTLLKKYERKTANHLFWSPCGQFVVLAGLRNMNGVLEFIDTSDFTTMNSGEHFMATDIEWDPTGRYIMTAVSWWGHKVDNAYWIWSFQGKLLKRFQTEKFCQFLWRPRPPSFLNLKQIKEIKRNLKKYSVDFDVVDKMKISEISKELLAKRKAKRAEFEGYRQACAADALAHKAQRLVLRGGVDTEDLLLAENEELEEEVVEFMVSEETFIVD